ncbi:MAG: maltose alpha-D-glucosyltransferase [Rhodospirillales bacterium]
MPEPISDDPLWYKDAVVYEVHVKAFFDANDDGMGDFAGLTGKLDYLQDLGVTAIWLLPFYPSPLRDDGYDIADYRSIHPSYGTMADFRRFVKEAHRRGLRVITELVVNHTSDQHPWFQRARRAPAGSRLRDWYVWSDNDQRYHETRIIFTDTERSNWAWDPEAHAYYWHRFFSHQPDLNFDNPQVLRAVINTMRFWLDSGVDGFRLDAIPYLCERDGTSNENLEPTHDVLKQLRAALDARYTNKLFLAEANQWPEDVQAYFGNGDECHMAYHFPLMPRMYMAIAQEDRHPITDIIRQTPDIPESCQWAVFLRNHDELTLEMVTDHERDYLWNVYAADRQARINLGIRRRLAPLMDNDRRKIELMKSLLMSMPGTPILYYGDEIGMGDNIFLGDRDGVRTPMQWTPDRNGGFSRADPARLYRPPLMDAVYGFQAINVEAQSRNTSSLLSWTKRLIAARQAAGLFGRGAMTFLYPSNRRILAYLRTLGDRAVLCVANLSRYPQAVELDLASYAGRIPVELLGRVNFPAIADGFYRLTLQGHSFLWFELLAPAEVAAGPVPAPEALPEHVTLVIGDSLQSITSIRSKGIFEREVLPAYLPLRRWYGAKDAKLQSCEVLATVPVEEDGKTWLLAVAETRFAGPMPAQRYSLPVSLEWREIHALPPATQAGVIAKIRRGAREGSLYEAVLDDAFALTLVRNIRAGREIEAGGNRVAFRPTAAFADRPMPEAPVVRLLGLEQSNTSILIEGFLVLKLFRRLSAGVHPEVEMGRFLTDVAGYANVPALLGTIEMIDAKGATTAMGVAHAFVRNQGDGWDYSLSYLGRFLDERLVLPADEAASEAGHELFLEKARQLGIRIAELHRALCPPGKVEAAFRPAPMGEKEIRGLVKDVKASGAAALKTLAERRKSLPAAVAERVAALLARRRELLSRIGAGIPAGATLIKTRCHGDLHLGQVVVAQNDFYVLDFEGEPSRPLDQRRRKTTPLRDVAGILRSFDYVAQAALDQATALTPDRRETLAPFALAWRDQAQAAFLGAYRETIAGCPSFPEDERVAREILNLVTLEKLFYEIGYELANRPHWVGIPVAGALDMLDGSR